MEDDKLIKIIASFGISFGLITMFGIPFMDVPNFMLGSLGISLFLTPGVYVGTKKINQRWHDKEEKRLRYIRQGFLNIAEDEYEKDKIIGKTTTNFYSKIEKMQKEFNVSLTFNDFEQVNDFLYLINSNYYEKISNHNKKFGREELLDKVINQVGFYLMKAGKSSFTRKDVLNILNNCFFIKDNIGDEIYQEYISSEVSFGKWIGHGIENRNVDIMDEEAFLKEKKKELPSFSKFDIDSCDDCKKIIQGIVSIDTYLGQFGDISQLEWNLEALQGFFGIMLKDHRGELFAFNSELSNFDFATSFIYNAMCYAVVNNKTEVGAKEMLHTLKNWEYIPWQLRLDIASDAMDKMDLDEEMLFYKKKSKNKSKIISFDQVKK